MTERAEAVVEAVGAFVDAFNAEDLDAFAASLDPEVEIVGQRDVVAGRDAARKWATREPSGGLRQRLALEEVRTESQPAVALVRREWRWADDDGLADKEELGVLVTVRDGRILRWQPVGSHAAALRAAAEVG